MTRDDTDIATDVWEKDDERQTNREQVSNRAKTPSGDGADERRDECPNDAGGGRDPDLEAPLQLSRETVRASNETRTPSREGGSARSNGAECACSDEVDEDRRDFVKLTAGGLASLGFVPLAEDLDPGQTIDEFFDQHYKKMSEREREAATRQLAESIEDEYNREDVSVATTEPLDDVVFGYALNIQKCIGCRRCVYACMKENNQSRANPEDPTDDQIQWIRVLAFDKSEVHPANPGGGGEGGHDGGHDEDGGESRVTNAIGTRFGDVHVGINFERGHHYYDSEHVPEDDKFYMPVQCQQCEDPPCTKACPTQATWKENDGVVTIDYDWCIGCRFCIAACPYYARHFNWSDPHLPSDELNPDMHYLGNRPRMAGVVEKCTFCIQRSREGRYPACVEACPVGARKFGNLLDPESEVRKVIDKKRVFRLKEDRGTEPKFFYFMD